jgi:hypothetical protein
MVNRSLLAVSLVFCALAVAACAGTGSASGTRARVLPAGCVATSATRVAVSPYECASAGRVHSGDDIRNTGTPDVGRALSMLDPAITTNGR